jgi:hypothetical protein
MFHKSSSSHRHSNTHNRGLLQCEKAQWADTGSYLEQDNQTAMHEPFTNPLHTRQTGATTLYSAHSSHSKWLLLTQHSRTVSVTAGNTDRHKVTILTPVHTSITSNSNRCSLHTKHCNSHQLAVNKVSARYPSRLPPPELMKQHIQTVREMYYAHTTDIKSCNSIRHQISIGIIRIQ